MHKFIFSYVFLLILPFYSFSQSPVFKNYNADNGLPSNEVYQTFQDSKGYLWIATDMGVSKFNGHRFQNFSSSNGLSDNTVFGFYEDYKERVWFRSYLGKISYYFNDSIKTIPLDTNLGLITYLMVDKKDTIHISTFFAEYKVYFNKEEDRYCYLKLKESKKRGVIDSLGSIHNKTLHILNQDSKNNGSFLSYGKKGINLITLESNVKIDKNPCYTICQDKGNLIWVYSEKGLFNFSLKNVNHKSYFEFFRNKRVTNIFMDDDGGYWFSTINNGLFYCSSLDIFRYQNNLIDNESIIRIVNNKKSLYLGTYSQRLFQFKKGMLHSIINGNKINGGNIGIGSHDKKIIFSSNGKSYSINDEGINIIDNEYISSSNPGIGRSVTFKNDITFFSGGGTKILKYRNDSLIHIEKDSPRNKPEALSICYDKNDQVLVGSLDGLWIYSIDNGYQYKGDSHPLFKERIDHILKDHYGRFWMAMRGKGIVIINDKTLINLTSVNGLAGDICNRIFLDSSFAWVSSQNGLSRININNIYDITNFNISDGLISNQINDINVFNDTTWIATDKGICFFYSKKIKKKSLPKIYINKIIVNDKPKKLSHNYHFSHNENIINIHYDGINFKSGQNISYKYRLKGLDTNWAKTKYQSIQFTTLPHGNYIFEVKSVNIDGVESLESARIKFTIHPPYWYTWWFISFFVLFIISFFFVILHYRIKKIKEKNIIRQKLVELELKLLRAHMNPHFIFNALNSIQHFILNNNEDEALKYVSKFSKLIRTMLEYSIKGEITIKKEIETLISYIEIENGSVALI
jgi:ligand-binding sensor domain-containing protein